MSDFFERLKAEKADLSERITKLDDFINSGKASDLHPVDEQLLLQQMNAMVSLEAILIARISRLEEQLG